MRKRLLAIVLVVSLFAAMMAVPALAVAKPVDPSVFTDLDANWYQKHVDYVAKNGYMVGISATEFGPEVPLSRAMFVTILARYTQYYSPTGIDYTDNTLETGFTDVDAESGRYFVGAVKWARDNEIVWGRTDTEFDPHADITREEMCALISRFVEFYEKIKGVGLLKNEDHEVVEFTDDAQISEYAKRHVEFCRTNGLVYGFEEKDGTFTFRPKKDAAKGEHYGVTRRAECAAIIYRLRWLSRDLIPDGIEAGVNYLNTNVAKLQPATAGAEKFGMTVGIDTITFDKEAKDLEVVTSASFALNEDFAEKLLQTAVYYAFKLVPADAPEEPAYTLDDVKNTVKAVAATMNIDISDKSAKAIADSVWAEVKNEASTVWKEFLTYPRVVAVADKPEAVQEASMSKIYLMDTLVVKGASENTLYTIDTNNGTGTTVSVGTKAGIKATAIEIAKQYRDALREASAGEIITKADIEAHLDVEFQSLATETILSQDLNHDKCRLTMKLSLDSNGLVGYSYTDMDNIYLYVPVQEVKDAIKSVITGAIGEAVDGKVEDYVKDSIADLPAETKEKAEAFIANAKAEITPEEVKAACEKNGIDVVAEAKKYINFPESIDTELLRDYLYELLAEYVRETAAANASGDAETTAETETPAADAFLASLKNVPGKDVWAIVRSCIDKLSLEGTELTPYLLKAMDYAKVFASYIPEDATVTVAGDTYTKADFAACTEAATPKEALYAAAAAMKDGVRALTLKDFSEDGVIINAKAKDYSVTARVFIKAK